MADMLSRQQVSLTAIVQGTGRTITGPLRVGVPGQTHAGIDGPVRPLGAEKNAPPSSTLSGRAAIAEDARDLLKIALAMEASVRTPEVSVYSRPATSTARRLATKVAPWLSPATLQDTARFSHSLGKSQGKMAIRKDPMISRPRAANEQQALELQKRVGHLRETLDKAVAELRLAQAQLQTARDASLAGHRFTGTEAEFTQAQTRVRSAVESVDAASGPLHQALHSTDLLELMNHGYVVADRVGNEPALSSRWIEDLKTQVAGVRESADARRNDIELELQAHARETADLKARNSITPTPDALVEQATGLLRGLEANGAKHAASGVDPLSAQVSALGSKIGQARGALDHALEQQGRYHEDLHRIAALNATVGKLMQQRAQADTRWHTADRALSSLRQTAWMLAQVRVKSASESVDTASSSLHEALHGTDLLELMNHSHLADRVDNELAFSLRRVADLETQVSGTREAADARRNDIELALQAHATETSDLRARNSITPTPDALAEQAARLLSGLSASRAKLAASGVDPLSAQVTTLESKIVQARGALDQALEQQGRYGQDLHRLAELNDTVGKLMQQRAEADGHWHTADRALSSLQQTARALKARKAQVDKTGQTESARTTVGEVPAAKTREVDAIQAARTKVVNQLAEVPRAFASQASSAELQAELKLLAGKLTAPQPPLPMPPHLVLEIVTRSMADVGADANQAARVLGELARHPVAHWVELAAARAESLSNGATGAAGADATDDISRIIAMCRKLAGLPRGSAILHALSGDAEQPLEPALSQALRVFWNADHAQRGALTEANGRADWLQQAKTVAKVKLAPAGEVAFDDVDHAAYNAVRNGYFSNLPGSAYDAHNQRLKKSITEWVIRASASGGKAKDSDGTAAKSDEASVVRSSAWRRAMPNLDKTPYGKRVLNQAYATSESMGLQSPRIKVDAAVQRRVSSLEGTIALCRQSGNAPGLGNDIVAAQAIVDHLKRLQSGGQHLSQIRLEAKDAKALGRMIGEKNLEVHRERTPNLLTKAAPVTLSESMARACGSGLTAYEALLQIKEHLIANSAEGVHPAESGSVCEEDKHLDAAIGLLKVERLGSKSDISTFFESFILNSRLRDRLRMGGGGTLGVNLPNLPYGAASPVVSPIFSTEKSRTDEAFVQLFMPILGMEMSFGAAHSRAKEATIGIAVGSQVAPGVSVQGAFTARAESQQVRTDSTVMRFFRTRHKDEEMRANMLNALDSMLRWDLIEPTRGRPYKDPLEAVLARNPEVVVTQLEGFTDTKTITARASGRLPSARFDDPHGVAQTLGVELSAFAKAERTRTRVSEAGGHVRIVDARGDVAQQKIGAAANLNFSPVANQTIPVEHRGPDGLVQSQSAPMQMGVERDFAWVKEQHEISPFLIDDKQDCDLDRHYSTPTDLLAEISGNRELWLMRCIETLEPDAVGEKDNAPNRLRATELLEKFEQDIAKLGESSNFCHYNVNYSMRGEAGASIDGYRAIAELASQRGDAEELARAQQSIDNVLLMRSTWRPLMLIVRERARDSTTVGWRSLLRLQQVANVDAQRTAAQFPPP